MKSCYLQYSQKVKFRIMRKSHTFACVSVISNVMFLLNFRKSLDTIARWLIARVVINNGSSKT